MQISRRELYNRVWSPPMSKLARELDISDVGLARACRVTTFLDRRAATWVKLAAGKAPPKPALSSAKIDTVELDAARHRIAKTPKVEIDGASIKAAQAAQGDALAGVAAATFDRLTNAKPSADGFVSCGSSRVIACSFSPATVERACRVLDAIERDMPAVSARFAHNQEAKRIEVDVGGERLGISLAENYTRTETVEVDPKYSWMKSRSFTCHFTGELRLTITGGGACAASKGQVMQIGLICITRPGRARNPTGLVDYGRCRNVAA